MSFVTKQTYRESHNRIALMQLWLDGDYMFFDVFQVSGTLMASDAVCMMNDHINNNMIVDAATHLYNELCQKILRANNVEALEQAK